MGIETYRQNISSLICFFLFFGLAGCAIENDRTSEDEIDAKKVLDGKEFYNKGKGTSAQFITDQRARLNLEAAIVRGNDPDIHGKSVKALADLYRAAKKGFDWNVQLLRVEVSAFDSNPKIDGVINPGEWDGAYCFADEYLLGETKVCLGKNATWYLGINKTHIFVAVEFCDPEVNTYSGTTQIPGAKIYEGDSLEFFIRPQNQDFLYYEFIVNPKGELWGLMHTYNKWGGHIAAIEQLDIGEKVASAITPKGFSVELAIPMGGLYGPWIRRAALPGDEFSFMFVRTNKHKAENSKSSPVPFLYDGHNIFGYINAIIK